MKKAPIVGIDLGTTHSLIGVRGRGGVQLFPGPDGSKLIPSVVRYEADGTVIVGADAKNERVAKAANTLYSVKRFLGRGKADVQGDLPFDISPSDEKSVRFRVGEKIVNPVEVSAAILRELKTIAEVALGADVTDAVVTVPAYFNNAQREATKLAGRLAGLEVRRIINEPTAACLAYGLDKKAHGLIAVYDFGGGTFDVSILRVEGGVFEVLATNGDTNLGGDDLDHEVARRLLAEASEGSAHNSHQAWPAFLDAAEKAKRELSDAEETTVSVLFGGRLFTRRLLRSDLEAWTRPILEKTLAPCRVCLSDAKLKVDRISDVLLVGGSTRMPLVRQMVREFFQRDPISSINPDEVVAVGAAVQASMLEGQTGMMLLDIIPLSLGIETMGGVVSKILHRNSTIPTAATEQYSTYVDGQTAVALHVVQGERELAADCRSLGRFELRGLPPLPAGAPKLEVQFVVDVNGILSVKATELRTGTVSAVTVNPAYGLDDEEVEKMLLASFENAESDFTERLLREARVEADSLIRAIRKSMSRAPEQLESPEEKTTIEAAVGALELSIASTETKTIKAAMETLNDVAKPFAERVMNNAVAAALQEHKVIKESEREVE